jgi:hypothetical protein
MKTIIRLIEECLNSPHKIRGRLCFLCFLVLIIGLIYTFNNFIDNPIKTQFQLERSK